MNLSGPPWIASIESPLAVASRMICSNRCKPPIYELAETGNSVVNQRVKRVSSAQADWSSIELTYTGWRLNGAEFPMTTAFTLRAAIEVNGVIHPVLFNGARDVQITADSVVKGTVPTLDKLPAGTVFYERTRIVLATAGNMVLINDECDEAFGEWTFRGTDANVDYTTTNPGGVGAVGYFNFSGTTITGLQTTAGGSGYAGSSCFVYAFDPDAGAHTGSLIAAPTVAGGVVTVGLLTSGLNNTTGWGPNTYPVYTLGGTSTYRSYHAALITGVPNRSAAKSLFILGDSNGAGYGATDGVGDENRCFGIYERALGNAIGVGNISFPGQTLSNWANEATYPKSIALYKDVCTHVLIQASGNDIGAGSSRAQVSAAGTSVLSNWKARGKLCGFATSVPRTTGTYTSDGGQTPATGFAAGSVIDAYNAAVVRQMNGLKSDWGPVLAYEAGVSPTTPNVWASIGGAWVTDGTHPNATLGLQKVASRLNMRTALDV